MDVYCRDPVSAAALAGAAVLGYIYCTAKMNNNTKLKNSAYFKPAFLVAILVFLIVQQGQGDTGAVLTTPY